MDTFIRIIADGTLLPIVLIGTYALLVKVPSKGRYAAYCRIAMAGLTAYLIAKYMATLYQPTGERPFEIMGIEPGAAYLNNPGFPSDHALFAGAILLAVWFETRHKVLAGTLAILVFLVCLGRVLAFVHTPLDVIGGLLAASIGAGWYFTALPFRKASKRTT